MEQRQIENLYKINEVELVYRYHYKPENCIQVLNSEDAYRVLRATWDENRIALVEEFKILLLDNGHNCLGVSTISSGGIGGCIADERIIFATALKARATRLILAHNHPTGRTTPSDADLRITEKLVAGGDILHIPVRDHLILTADDYLSLADEGQMTAGSVQAYTFP